ncbi:hypothetical protein AB0271_11730 [Kocuria palustris]|uniref:hypothetical protein n=1 Tax=Kocuria palustris TaxID=71999 RepID=UPI00077B8422|nr:hypothetical protein [Kocuria palustris]
MQQTSVLIQAAEGGHHIVNELPVDGPWFGIMAFIVFMLLLITTLTFGPRSQSPDDTDHHVDPAQLPADEAAMLASYSAKRGH